MRAGGGAGGRGCGWAGLGGRGQAGVRACLSACAPACLPAPTSTAPLLPRAGFTGLAKLKIARRPFLTDAQLAPVLTASAATLQELTLASCAALTDAALAPLASPRAPLLAALHLVCCERMTGAGAAPLRALRALRFSGCPAVAEAAVQAAAVGCTRLTMLELPSHLNANCIPVAGAGSRLSGLRVVGGGPGHRASPGSGGRLLYSSRRQQQWRR